MYTFIYKCIALATHLLKHNNANVCIYSYIAIASDTVIRFDRFLYMCIVRQSYARF